jgi:hypothetical protein
LRESHEEGKSPLVVLKLRLPHEMMTKGFKKLKRDINYTTWLSGMDIGKDLLLKRLRKSEKICSHLLFYRVMTNKM